MPVALRRAHIRTGHCPILLWWCPISIVFGVRTLLHDPTVTVQKKQPITWFRNAQHMIRFGRCGLTSNYRLTKDTSGATWRGSGHSPLPLDREWERALRRGSIKSSTHNSTCTCLLINRAVGCTKESTEYIRSCHIHRFRSRRRNWCIIAEEIDVLLLTGKM